MNPRFSDRVGGDHNGMNVDLKLSVQVVVQEKKPGFGKKGEPLREAPVRVQVLNFHTITRDQGGGQVGKFAHLNEKWRPLYKLVFREPAEEEELAQICIQNFVVLDRSECR